MVASFDRAVARLISTCRYVTAVHDLETKWRIELINGYILDLWFNESLGKYSYALIKENKRVLGWDNAPHHPHLANFPHHLHLADGRIEPSSLSGNPSDDLEQICKIIETWLST
ncbi:MAG: DUF6516 family protein [Anaerolineae bacterium]|nr:DUF6516 family protein [Anaerolineae bacterium]